MSENAVNLEKRMQHLLQSLEDLVQGDSTVPPLNPPPRRFNHFVGRPVKGKPPAFLKVGLHTCRAVSGSSHHRQRTLCRACAGYTTTQFPRQAPRPEMGTHWDRSSLLRLTRTMATKPQHDASPAMQDVSKTLLRVEALLEQQQASYGNSAKNEDTLMALRQVQRQIEAIGQHARKKPFY